MAEVVGAEPGQTLMAEVAATGGNPLYVSELLAALLEEGTIRTVSGRAEVAEMTLPPTLRLTILRRLSFLPDDTLEALRAASMRRASGWPGREPGRCAWPSTWPAGPLQGTPRPSPG